jgi:hypothetical protein
VRYASPKYSKNREIPYEGKTPELYEKIYSTSQNSSPYKPIIKEEKGYKFLIEKNSQHLEGGFQTAVQHVKAILEPLTAAEPDIEEYFFSLNERNELNSFIKNLETIKSKAIATLSSNTPSNIINPKKKGFHSILLPQFEDLVPPITLYKLSKSISKPKRYDDLPKNVQTFIDSLISPIEKLPEELYQQLDSLKANDQLKILIEALDSVELLQQLWALESKLIVSASENQSRAARLKVIFGLLSVEQLIASLQLDKFLGIIGDTQNSGAASAGEGFSIEQKKLIASECKTKNQLIALGSIISALPKKNSKKTLDFILNNLPPKKKDKEFNDTLNQLKDSIQFKSVGQLNKPEVNSPVNHLKRKREDDETNENLEGKKFKLKVEDSPIFDFPSEFNMDVLSILEDLENLTTPQTSVYGKLDNLIKMGGIDIFIKNLGTEKKLQNLWSYESRTLIKNDENHAREKRLQAIFPLLSTQQLLVSMPLNSFLGIIGDTRKVGSKAAVKGFSIEQLGAIASNCRSEIAVGSLIAMINTFSSEKTEENRSLLYSQLDVICNNIPHLGVIDRPDKIGLKKKYQELLGAVESKASATSNKKQLIENLSKKVKPQAQVL